MLHVVNKIWQAISTQCLESQIAEFKLHVPLKRKPVKLFKECVGRKWKA